MPVPNIPNAAQLIAAANVSAATPPVVTGAVGIAAAGVTRTGAGVWVVNLEQPCDPLDRKVSLTSSVGANAYSAIQLDAAVQTDTTIGVLGFITAAGPVAGDVAWEIVCWRVGIFQ